MRMAVRVLLDPFVPRSSTHHNGVSPYRDLMGNCTPDLQFLT
jgi:hypothetical protein